MNFERHINDENFLSRNNIDVRAEYSNSGPVRDITLGKYAMSFPSDWIHLSQCMIFGNNGKIIASMRDFISVQAETRTEFNYRTIFEMKDCNGYAEERFQNTASINPFGCYVNSMSAAGIIVGPLNKFHNKTVEPMFALARLIVPHDEPFFMLFGTGAGPLFT